MKVLFTNKITNQTISSVSEDASYPAKNLYSPILKRRWQSTSNSDVVTIVFPAPVDINCLFFGWTNADTVGIDFLDAADAVLYSVGRTIERVTEGLDLRITESGDTRLAIGAYYEIQYDYAESFFFNTISVKKIQIQLDTADPTVFVGGLSAGVYEDLGIPMDNWGNSYIDGSIVSQSPDGQVIQNYIRPLKEYEFELRDLSFSEKNYFIDLYVNNGQGKQVWADFFSDDHTYLNPLYCALSAPIVIQKQNNRFGIKWKFREAR